MQKNVAAVIVRITLWIGWFISLVPTLVVAADVASRGDLKRSIDGSHTGDSTAFESQSPSLGSVRVESYDDSTKRIGSPIELQKDLSYDPPFTEVHYRPEVAKVLQKHPSFTGSTTDWNEADWLTELGVAHSTIVTGVIMEKTFFGRAAETMDDEEGSDHQTRSVVALQIAATMLEDESEMFSVPLFYKQAMVLVSLAEAYHSDYQTYSDAYKLFTHIKGAFNDILVDPYFSKLFDKPTRHKIRLGWADARIKFGWLLLCGHVQDDVATDDAIVRAKQAAKYFRDGITVLRAALRDGVKLQYRHTMVARQLELSLAYALNFLVMSLYQQGDKHSTIVLDEEAVELFQSVLEREPHHVSTMPIVHAIGEGFRALTGTNFRLGRYDAAKEWYAKRMQWYEMYQFRAGPSPVNDAANEDEEPSGAIEEHERMLQKYVSDGTSRDDPRKMFVEADMRLYVGHHLHWLRGKSSLDDHRVVEVMGQLETAIWLYEQSGNASHVNMGFAKYFLAFLRLRNGEWSLSKRLYWEALDLFAAHSRGKDESPILQELQERNLMEGRHFKPTIRTPSKDLLVGRGLPTSRRSNGVGPALMHAQVGVDGAPAVTAVLLDTQYFMEKKPSMTE